MQKLASQVYILEDFKKITKNLLNIKLYCFFYHSNPMNLHLSFILNKKMKQKPESLEK